MANRIVLNTISYHGQGAIKEIPGEIQRRGYKKVFVCSDPDLVKFGVTKKVTDLLDEAGIALGAKAFLIGETLMRAEHPGEKLCELLSK